MGSGGTKDLLPRGEELRRAVKWISERRTERDGKTLPQLIDEAAIQFDLTPLQSEFLLKTFKDDRG
jgi:hypothetical protein